MATNAQIQSILDYFGSNSSIYRKIVFGTATDAEISYALTQIPQMKVDVSAAGTTLGYSYVDPVYIVPNQTDDIISSINSNNGISSLGGGGGSNTNYNVSFGRDPVTGQAYIEAGKNSLSQTIMAVADRVALGVCGVNIGAKLGKAIDESLYNLNPAWWDKHFPTINPDTWPSLVGENELGQKFFRTLFNIDDNGNVTGYVDERILAQTYQMLRDLGAWNTSGIHTVINPPDGLGLNGDVTYATSDNAIEFPSMPGVRMIPVSHTNERIICVGATDNAICTGSSRPGQIMVTTTEETAVLFKAEYVIASGAIRDYRTTGGGTFTFDNKSVKVGAWNGTYGISDYTYPVNKYLQSGWATFYCDSQGGNPIPGINEIPNTTQYPPTNITGTTLDDVLQQLKQQYPDLFDNSITDTVLQPDGTTQTVNYVPIPWQIANPTDTTQTSPITQPNPTTTTQIDPDVAPEIITHPQTETQPFDDTTTPPPTTTTPDTGEGNTDPIVLPTGQASSLWAIYNPTQAQLDSFGGWLWSSNFVEQLKKLFNDPMQAIIGVHKVFAPPSTGESRTIVCGYLDSGVSSKIVTSQYSKVDCGSVSLQEYFGNVFDYSPFTTVKIFLPFIGIVPLDVAYIMRSTISVEYTVDVLTGACLANVTVSRDGCGGVLFTYGGSAIVSYPISSGSYTGVVAGALSLATGIVGTVASGGAMLPATLGALSGLGRMRTEVQHSGQFSGSAGAMGGKKPYLIISRPQTRVAGNVENYEGKPSNVTIKIGDCVGFTRVIQSHLIIPNAYDYEIKEIEELLYKGIIINDGILPPPPSSDIQPIQITANGTYNAPSNLKGYNPVTVNVENSYTQSDEGKVVVNGELVDQTSLTITENGTYDTTENNEVLVDVSGGTIAIETASIFRWLYSVATTGWGILKKLNGEVIGQNIDNTVATATMEGVLMTVVFHGTSQSVEVTAKTNISLSVYRSNRTMGIITPTVISMSTGNTETFTSDNLYGGLYIEAINA